VLAAFIIRAMMEAASKRRYNPEDSHLHISAARTSNLIRHVYLLLSSKGGDYWREV
jgi:hypothetical protein